MKAPASGLWASATLKNRNESPGRRFSPPGAPVNRGARLQGPPQRPGTLLTSVTNICHMSTLQAGLMVLPQSMPYARPPADLALVFYVHLWAGRNRCLKAGRAVRAGFLEKTGALLQGAFYVIGMSGWKTLYKRKFEQETGKKAWFTFDNLILLWDTIRQRDSPKFCLLQRRVFNGEVRQKPSGS